eukprot:1158898-Pelagomonas_calceolata.AAC.3
MPWPGRQRVGGRQCMVQRMLSASSTWITLLRYPPKCDIHGAMLQPRHEKLAAGNAWCKGCCQPH